MMSCPISKSNINNKNKNNSDELDRSDVPARGQVWCRTQPIIQPMSGTIVVGANNDSSTRISKIIFLGTGSSIPAPNRRNTSSMAVVMSSGSIMLIDCGEATQHQIMLSQSIKLQKIDSILITHLHGDHCYGIFGLLCTMASSGRRMPVVIAGPTGLKEMISTVLRISGGFTGFPLSFIQWEDGTEHDLGLLNNGSLHVTAYPGALDVKKAKAAGVITGKELGKLKNGENVQVNNGEIVYSHDCVAPPIPGRKVAIIQDTCDSTQMIPVLLPSVDLLIHECTYDAANQEKAIAHGHSTSTMAATFGAVCNAQMIVLTHFSNRFLMRDGFKGDRESKQQITNTSSSSSSSYCPDPTTPTPTAAEDSSYISRSSKDGDHDNKSSLLYQEDLISEAMEAYKARHSSKDAPKGGIVGAQDFLVIESVKGQQFRVNGFDRVGWN